MIFKNSPISIQDNIKDLDNSSSKPPIFDDLISKQNIKRKRTKTVHRRRDLDSLG
tara:strand:+ start:2710 stop:2874 length:165 start_codon:yes stop_codon:yes gene_type:complete